MLSKKLIRRNTMLSAKKLNFLSATTKKIVNPTLDGCKLAVDEFIRTREGIKIQQVPTTGCAYWKIPK